MSPQRGWDDRTTSTYTSTVTYDNSWPWNSDYNHGNSDDDGLSDTDRLLVIILPSIFGGLLVLWLLWTAYRLAHLRRRVLGCEERELVHDAAIAAVKDEREQLYGAGWRHGRERERRKRDECVVPVPVPYPYPVHAGHKGHHRRHRYDEYPPPHAIGYPGY